MDKYHSGTTPSSDGTLRAEKDLVYRPPLREGELWLYLSERTHNEKKTEKKLSTPQGKNKYLCCHIARYYHQQAGLGQNWARSRTFLFCWGVTNYLFLLRDQTPKNLEWLVGKVGVGRKFQIQVYPYILYKPKSSLLTVSGVEGKRFVIKPLKFTS